MSQELNLPPELQQEMMQKAAMEQQQKAMEWQMSMEDKTLRMRTAQAVLTIPKDSAAVDHEDFEAIVKQAIGAMKSLMHGKLPKG